MNKNMVYVAVLAVLCVLTGVIVGAGIASKPGLPWPCHERQDFSRKAEFFMKHGPKGPDGGRHFMGHGHRVPGHRGSEGLFEMFTNKLSLDKDQQIKVKSILEETRREIDRIGKDVRNAVIEVKEKGDKQIMNMLNPDQQKKFKVMIDEFKERCGSNRPGEELPPPQD